ncbi:hypothetical protein GCM10020229_27650 [Kitasatospora albolonga]|uniref:hypothetical protein n=1 Tax=Kitasatospora albolonga TaxID=68173 RepID=UPI0031E8FBDC
MPSTVLRDQYTAAAERLADRVLDALNGAERPVTPPHPTDPAELAALRLLGPDLFAPQLLTRTAPDRRTATALAAALTVFPPSTDPLTTAWLDHTSGLLAARPVPQPDRTPDPADSWQRWSAQLALLAPLALPGLDGPVHRSVRREPLALARGTVRAALRGDHRTGLRLLRWCAWLAHLPGPGPLPPALRLPPLLAELRLTGDGSSRTTLQLTLTERLLATRGVR